MLTMTGILAVRARVVSRQMVSEATAEPPGAVDAEEDRTHGRIGERGAEGMRHRFGAEHARAGKRVLGALAALDDAGAIDQCDGRSPRGWAVPRGRDRAAAEQRGDAVGAGARSGDRLVAITEMVDEAELLRLFPLVGPTIDNGVEIGLADPARCRDGRGASGRRSI